MEKMKKYENFVEDKVYNKLYESFLEGALDKVVSFFKNKFKKGSWLHLAMFLKKKNLLPKNKVEIFTYGSGNVSGVEPTEKELEVSESLNLNEDKVDGRVPLESPNPQIRDIDADQLVATIKRKFRLKLENPDEQFSLFVWGAPGIGKTDIIKQTAKDLGADIIIWHLSTIEPTDFVGLPKIKPSKLRGGEERTIFALPEIFPSDNGPKDKGGIMFFDELNRANNMVLSASLQLCLDGKVGEYTLPSKWLVIAAGNRKEEVPEVTDIEPALGNRFSHVNLVTSIDRWIDWALTKDYMHGDVMAFVEFNKDFVHYLDTQNESPNWPSPRRWATASREYVSELKVSGGRMSKADVTLLFAEHVGNKAALAFAEYLDLKDKFNEKDVKEVYEKGDKFKKQLPTNAHQSRAACASIAFYKKPTSDVKSRLKMGEMKNVLDYALSLGNFEIATSLLSYFKRVHPYIKEEEPWAKVYNEYIKKWHTDKYQKI